MSCLTTISRFAGWHLTTDGEPSLTSFPFRGLQSQNNNNIIKRYRFGTRTQELGARWSNECLECSFCYTWDLTMHGQSYEPGFQRLKFFLWKNVFVSSFWLSMRKVEGRKYKVT